MAELLWAVRWQSCCGRYDGRAAVGGYDGRAAVGGYDGRAAVAGTMAELGWLASNSRPPFTPTVIFIL